MNPFQTAAIRQQAFRAYESAQFEHALQLGEQILPRLRSDGQLFLMIGSAARALGFMDQAAKHLKKAASLLPRDPAVLVELGRLRFSQGRFDEAVAELDRALRFKPGFQPALAVKAGVLEHRGDYAAARTLLEPVVAASAEDDAMAVVFARLLQEAGEPQHIVPFVARHLANPRTGPLNRQHLLDSLARAHDSLGEYDMAFAAYRSSNQLQARPFDADAYLAEVDRLIAFFSGENIQRLSRSDNRDETPVFIASMPRSGSTLVEQIIHAHPMGFGAGEITHITELTRALPSRLDSYQTYPECAADLTVARARSIGDEYLRELMRLGGTAARIVNKALDNALHLGLVQLLLPGARVIHVKRDAMDNCFSCYTAALLFPWANQLEHIAMAYRACERLMRHWVETLDLPILEVEYELLVADPEAGIRRIIEFCGLPWDERCLRYWESNRSVMTLSYDQVRKPIYASSVKRYERYAEHLKPLRLALGIS